MKKRVGSLIKCFSKNDVIVSAYLFAAFFVSLFPSLLSNSASFETIQITFKCVFLALMIFALVYILLKTKTNIPFSIVVFEIIFLVCGLAILLTNRSLQSMNILISIGSLAGTVLLIDIAILSRRVFNKNILFLFSLLVILFSLIACIYSNIVEASAIKNAFLADGEESHFYQIQSFFENKNSYGFILSVSIVCLIIILLSCKNSIPFVAPVYFYILINLIFSRCKIALLSVLIVSTVAFLILLFKLKRSHKLVFWILIGSSLSLIVILCCVVFIPQIYNCSSFLQKLNNYVNQGFLGQAQRSFESRINQFNSIAPLFANLKILIGYGEKVSLVQINGVQYSTNIDNAYASILISGGFPKLFLYIAIIIFALINLYRLNKINKLYFVVSLSMFACSIIYGLFEGYTFVGMSVYSMVWSIAILVYPLISINDSKKSEHKEVRILHVVGSLNKGGTEAFVFTYLIEMKKHANISFDIFCFGGADSNQIEKLHSNGGDFYLGKSPSRKGLIISLSGFYKFLLKHFNYRAIHCSANFDNFVYLYVANLLDVDLRIQHAHDTLTGIKFTSIQSAINKLKQIANNYNSNKSFACSLEAGKDIIGKTFFKKGIIIPNSIDYHLFIDCEKDAVSKLVNDYSLNGKKVFGNISRFEDKKNQQFMVELFKQYHCKNNDSILVLGGIDGGNLEKIKNMVSASNLSSAVLFIGPRDDVECWLQIIDVYLMPSLFEGFGISAIEAQISGAYVIASDNLPTATDVGLNRISYISLSKSEEWLEHMSNEEHNNNLDVQNAKYNIRDDYKILLSEYGVAE